MIVFLQAEGYLLEGYLLDQKRKTTKVEAFR